MRKMGWNRKARDFRMADRDDDKNEPGEGEGSTQSQGDRKDRFPRLSPHVGSDQSRDPDGHRTEPQLRQPRLGPASGSGLSASRASSSGSSGNGPGIGANFGRQPPPLRRPTSAPPLRPSEPPPLPTQSPQSQAPFSSRPPVSQENAPRRPSGPEADKAADAKMTSARTSETTPTQSRPAGSQAATPRSPDRPVIRVQATPVLRRPDPPDSAAHSQKASLDAGKAPAVPPVQKHRTELSTATRLDASGKSDPKTNVQKPIVFRDLPEPPRPRLREEPAPRSEATPRSETAKSTERRQDTDRRDTVPPVQARVDGDAPKSAVVPLDREAARPRPTKPVLIAKNEGLVVTSLGKQFKKRPVLRDVSLRVQRGEAVGLLGPNGAGKTTCFYIVTGLIAADYGQIMLDGADITELPMYRRSRLGIGYLPQESSIFRGLTVEQNIMAVLELIEKNREKRDATLDALMAEFSISHLRRTPAIALSGGERRRLEIARALASQPNFVLLDEPLAGIDPIAVRDIRQLVSHLKDRGIGVLITDHNVRETLDIVDRAYILHDGSVLMEGTPDEIVANQEVRRVYLGDRFSL
jgi:lipopolysaccharide export system ATP-binding protein